MTYGIIASVNAQGVIGVDNDLPWHYPADLKRFKRITTGHTIIMGRRTWASLPKRPLPQRRNIVLTQTPLNNVACFTHMQAAMDSTDGDIWFIGGARVFAEAMAYADCIDLTWVPDSVAVNNKAVMFPSIDMTVWRAEPKIPYEDDPRLLRQMYYRQSR